MTHIVAQTEQGQENFWNPILDDAVALARHAGHLRRAAISTKFERILDAYYDAIAHGDSPNLREMARAAGVNEGSLRQAKVRYDKRRRSMSMSDNTHTE